jgi:2-polyprenyl-6-methoxyphenol hydroxylase-like FAD-dependent oxidoreductase
MKLPSTNSSQSISHAVVVGGSIAGLLAAKVLAAHFDRVTIIERDLLPQGAAPRKGVPHARHIHVLLMRGLMILEWLFPGIPSDLKLAGALAYDTAADVAWLTPAGWVARFRSDMIKLTSSRDLLESTIRNRLSQVRNIRMLDGCDTAGLILKDGEQVCGVRVRSSSAAAGVKLTEWSLPADLIVDATGRGSPAPKWLQELGYEAPRETTVNAFLGYASRLYKAPAEFKADWKLIVLQPAPPLRPRGGLLLAIEGNRWLMSLAGGDHDYPPTDEEGFLAFARTLPSPIIYEAVQNAEPLSPVYSYRATANRLRHYDKLQRLPEGLLLVGDSVCTFNPIYGQGMTTAAMAAVLLDECLHEQRKKFPDGSLNGLTKKFQKKLARITRGPWMFATGADFRYRETDGNRTGLRLKLMHWYVDHVVALGTENEDLRRRFLEVTQMLKSPAALFHPVILLNVLKRALTKRSAVLLKDGGLTVPLTQASNAARGYGR